MPPLRSLMSHDDLVALRELGNTLRTGETASERQADVNRQLATRALQDSARTWRVQRHVARQRHARRPLRAIR